MAHCASFSAIERVTNCFRPPGGNKCLHLPCIHHDSKTVVSITLALRRFEHRSAAGETQIFNRRNEERVMSKKCELVLAVAGALVLPAMCSANAAEAAVQARQPRTFNSTVTHTGPAGNTITRQSTLTTNGRGGFSATSTWTGPKGDAIATSQRSGSYDP